MLRLKTVWSKWDLPDPSAILESSSKKAIKSALVELNRHLLGKVDRPRPFILRSRGWRWLDCSLYSRFCDLFSIRMVTLNPVSVYWTNGAHPALAAALAAFLNTIPKRSPSWRFSGRFGSC